MIEDQLGDGAIALFKESADAGAGPVAFIQHEGGVGAHAVDGAITLDLTPGPRFPVSFADAEPGTVMLNELWGVPGRTGGAAAGGGATSIGFGGVLEPSPSSPLLAVLDGANLIKQRVPEMNRGGAAVI